MTPQLEGKTALITGRYRHRPRGSPGVGGRRLFGDRLGRTTSTLDETIQAIQSKSGVAR